MSVISNNTLAGSSGQGGGGYQIERSLRFDSADSSFLNFTPSSSGSSTTWTLSTWIKQCKDTDYSLGILSSGSNPWTSIELIGNNIRFKEYNGGTAFELVTDQVFRDFSAWFHLVVVYDSSNSTSSDRIRFYVNGARVTSFSTATYPSQNRTSLFGSTVSREIGKTVNAGNVYADQYLADYQFIDGQALAATDFGELDDSNVWQPKKYSGSYGTNGFHLDFSDTSSNAALGTDTSGNGNTWTVNNLAATNLGATTNSSVSASNTYVVSDVMATVTGTYDFENAFDGNSGTIGYIGQVIFHNEGTYSKPIVANSSGGVEVMGSGAGITAAINGGSQVNCANGGFTKISGTFNGTLDSINVYNNTSGASYFTAVRVNGVEIAVRRQSPASEIDLYRDSPVNGNSANDTGAGGEITGNYATMNPLSKTSVITLSNGNLQISASQGHAKSTIGISSGKWYAEYTQGTGLGMCGVADKTAAAANYLGQTGNGYGYYSSGTTYAPGAAGSSYGASYTTGDVIGIAFDADNGTLVFYKNGSSQGTAFTGLTSGPYFFAVGVDTMANSTINFGQRAFAYTAPSGYKALCTANLPDPTIADGSTAFDTKLYTGDSAALASNTIVTTTGYRHHRVYFEGDTAGGSVSEIQFFDASGLIDASDTNNAGNSISTNGNRELAGWTAFNGTLGGASYADGVRADPSAGFYIQKDWGVGNTKTLTGVKIWGVNNYGLAGNTANRYVLLQGSDDGSTWTIVQSWAASRNGTWTSDSSNAVGHISGTEQTISGLNFSPDLAWIKTRSNAYSHQLYDSVRGAGSAYNLQSDNTSAEGSNASTYGFLASFTSDGFTLGNGSSSNIWVNQSSDSYVAWAWDAGSSNTTIAAGSLNSSVYDQSQTWSNNVTNASGTYGAASQAFDGSFTTHASPSNESPMTYTNPSASDTVISTFEIYTDIYSMTGITLELNSTDITSQVSTTAQWHTITGFSGQNFSNLKWNANSSNHEVRVRAVKVNGKTLVDSGVTPSTNVPSITSTVRANPSAGFSIVSYTGSGSAATIGHNLNTVPSLVIVKNRDAGNYWQVFHVSVGNTKSLHLNASDSADTASSYWNDTSPTTSVFSVGSSASVNNSGSNFIAYCFAPVEGYSAMGTYLGNGSSPPFVFTGFRPRFIMIKCIDDAYLANWLIWDSERSPYNVASDEAALAANLSDAEGISGWNGNGPGDQALDILSNGFKIRMAGTAGFNDNGDTYLYYAIAEHPFKTSRAR